MKRLWITMSLIALCAACQRDNAASVEQRQAQQRADLAAQQEHDRVALAQRQAQELAHAQQVAQDDLANQTREAQQRQMQAAQATNELSATLVAACAGIDVPAQARCPVVPAVVTSVRDVDHGVEVRLQPGVGTRDDVQHRIDCYLGRRTAQVAALTPSQNTQLCLIDLAGVAHDVRADHGAVNLQLTTSDDARLQDLRSRAHTLVRHAAR